MNTLAHLRCVGLDNVVWLGKFENRDISRRTFSGGTFPYLFFTAVVGVCLRKLGERQKPVATSPNLEDMKLPELKELAKQMGLRGISTMRKPELIATLQAARSGGEAPAGVTVRAPKSAAFAASAVPAAQAEEVGKPAEVAEVKADDAENSEKPASKTSGRAHVERAERSSRRKQAEASGEDAADVMAAVNALDSFDEAPKRRRRRDTEAATDLLAELGLDDASPKQDDRRRHRKDDEVDAEPRRRRRAVEEPKDEDVVRDLDDILATLPSQGNEDDERHGETEDGNFARRVRGRASDRDDRADHRGRRLRGRDRDYDERDDRRGRNSDRNDRNNRADRNDRTDRNVEREQRH